MTQRARSFLTATELHAGVHLVEQGGGDVSGGVVVTDAERTADVLAVHERFYQPGC